MILVLVAVVFIGQIGLVIGQAIYIVQLARLGRIDLRNSRGTAFCVTAIAAMALYGLVDPAGWPGLFLYQLVFLECLVFLVFVLLDGLVWRRISRIRLGFFLLAVFFEGCNFASLSWSNLRIFDDHDAKKLAFRAFHDTLTTKDGRLMTFESYVALYPECCEVTWHPRSDDAWYASVSDSRMSRLDLITNRLIFGDVWAKVILIDPENKSPAPENREPVFVELRHEKVVRLPSG